jgi:hypothetical protein
MDFVQLFFQLKVMMSHRTKLGLLVAVVLTGAFVGTDSWAAGNQVQDLVGKVGDTCFVADPTSSPLNVRNRPNGRIVGKIANGSEVVIKTIKKDRKGKAWAKIVQQNSESSSGYVILKYLQCP